MAFDILGYLNSTGAGNAMVGNASRVSVSGAAPKPAKQNFLGNVAHSVGGFAKSTAVAVAHSVVDPAARLVQGTAHNIQLSHLNVGARLQTQQSKQAALDKAFASKKISRQQYVDGLKGLNSEGLKLSADAHKVATTRYTAGQVAKDYAQTAGTVATLAAPGLSEGAGVLAGVRGATTAARVADAGLATGKFIGPQNRGVVSAAASIPGKLARNALVAQPVIGAPGHVVEDVKQGKYGSAALEVGAFAAPAVVKGAKALGRLAPAARDAVFGREGFFGAVKAAGGPDVLAHVNSLDGQDGGKAAKIARQLQQYNLDQFNGDAKKAGQYFVQTLKEDNIDPSKLTPAELLDHARTWAKAHTAIAKAGAEGRVTDEVGNVIKLRPGQRFIAARANPTDIKGLRTRFADAKTAEQRHAIIDDMAKAGASFGKNDRLMARLHAAADSPDWKKQLAPNNLPQLHPLQIHKPGSIVAKEAEPAAKEFGPKITRHSPSETPIAGNPQRLPGGYFPAVTDSARADLKAAKDTAALDAGVAAKPVVGAVGNALVKSGLSPQATNNTAIKGALIAAFEREMKTRNIPGDAKGVLNTLNNVDRIGALDARNLSKSDIQGALGASYSQHAGELQKALKAAYASLPREIAGLGPSVLNKAIKNVPGLGTYLRLQSIGRYEVNPFFRVRQYIKSGIIAGAEGAKLGVKASQDDIAALQEAGLFSRSGSRFGGDATLAGNLGGGSGSKLLDPVLRGMVAKTAASVAKTHGMTVREVLSSDTPLAREMKQSLSLVTTYGKGGYLNSPFAKTLNLVVFPSRFETKVAMEAAKAFAKASPLTQVAVAGGLAHTAAFLGSPQGKQWQKDNSELLGIIKAFTPLQTIDNFVKFIHGGHIGDLGELGGLPVGVLSQILEHQGVNLGKIGSSQYFDPKTGDPVPDKIPQTMKARLQSGLTDLLGSMYSYPGRTAGLSSKTNVTQTVVPFAKPNPKDVKSEFRNGQVAPSISKVATPSDAAKSYKPTPGTVPTIKKVQYTPGPPKKKKGARPKIYAKKYGQPL